ncbi:MAG TPA: Ig domain-containing protein, partial [Candidatus Ozemobacteraceae bacterium]|nr:Ig domain-containing protein [Candidatus Ozemobacteraceae bacterium]
RILHHFSMRMLLLPLIGGIAMFFFGCMGGGGGGGVVGPSPKEKSLVVEQVQLILNVLASGDGGSLEAFRRSEPGGDIPDGGRFHPLFVRDLGPSLSDPNDGNVYTFFFDPEEITFPLPSLAVVPIWTWFRSGDKFSLEIRLIEEDERWYLEDLKMATFDLTQAAAMGGPVPSSALWPMTRDDRWQFVEIQAPPSTSLRARVASRINAMVLNATRVDFRTLVIGNDPTLESGGRATFRLQMSAFGANLATSQLDLPIDPGTFEFGRFANGVSAVDRGFFPQPSGAVTGDTLWDILDPARQGFIRMFEQSGLYLEGGDTCFNGGRPWRLADLLVQEGAAATQSITLSIPGSVTRTGEARILVMESVPVSLPWLHGLAHRFDICLTWNGSAEVTWTSLFFLPGMGLVGYADYDLTTRHPVRFAWLWGASVGGRQFLPAGETGPLAPFVTLAINPVETLQWEVGTPFTQSLTASGGQSPYDWSVSGAPSWVAIEAGTGRLNGTPTQAGSYSFDITVRDAGNLVATLPVLASVARAPAPAVSGITPAEGFQGGSSVQVEVAGSNFFGMPQIRLASASAPGPTATGLMLVDAGRLSC